MRARHLRNELTLTTVLLLTAACLWAPAAQAAYPAATDDGVQFSYQNAAVQAVFVAGDFNGWNAAELALTKNDTGLWTITVKLDPGTYEYKFIVDGSWVQDPDNPETKTDPFGGANSLLTVNADGGVVASAAKVTAPVTQTVPSADEFDIPDDLQAGRPIQIEAGILFTYDNPGANSVFLAGTFNGWNASDLELTQTASGVWAIVVPMETGEHEYKFVVDGSWFADPENPDTKSDPYGGSNSLVTIDAEGTMIMGAGADAPAADADSRTRTNLNPNLDFSGRYITRMEFAKNIMADPRWRLQRPAQSVDLNFDVEVNEIASSFVRIRMDSDQNIIQNNIAGFLDEANLRIRPRTFNLTAYWNQETFTSHDPKRLVGNLDLPGTIGHDHLDFGKGTAGAAFDAVPWGITLRGFFGNVHNQDYYGDPELYDNTGEDVMSLRLSKRMGNFELGVPLALRRGLIWLNFEDRVGGSTTGIPAMDEYLARTGDSSTWFQTENRDFNYSLDMRYWLAEETVMLAAQGTYNEILQQLATGNESGQNNTNGAVDVPFLERDVKSVRGEINWYPREGVDIMLQHTWGDMTGANQDQRRVELTYLPQSEANKQLYFEINDSPAQGSYNWTELEGEWTRDNTDLRFWIWHRGESRDYASSTGAVPGDTTRTSHKPSQIYVSGLIGSGLSKNTWGHAELEFGLTFDDPDVKDDQSKSLEFIVRYEKDLSRTLAAIADVRFIHYTLEGDDDDTGLHYVHKEDYVAPFVGLRYRPLRKLELVLAYGVDPIDYSIDYNGRHMGRWWYRQRWGFENPGVSVLQAEQYLEDARVITLRAQLVF